MNAADQIADGFGKVLFVEQVERFERIFSATEITNLAKDFASIARMFGSMNEDDKAAVMDLIRIVTSDTASILLGSFDGSTGIEGIDKDFLVLYGGENVTGKLQDSFLSWVERFEKFSS